MAKAKGTTLLSLVKFLRSQRERAQRLLPQSLHHYLEDRVSPSSWYPETDLLALLRCMLELIPGSREAVLDQLGSSLAREHLEGIYEHLKLDANGDPATLARRCFALWSSQHDTGSFRLEIQAPGHALLEVRDYALPSEEMCGVLRGYLAESLRVAGAAHVKVTKRTCRNELAESCSWLTVWDA